MIARYRSCPAAAQKGEDDERSSPARVPSGVRWALVSEGLGADQIQAAPPPPPSLSPDHSP